MVTIPSSARYFADANLYLRANYRIQLRREIVDGFIGSPQGKRILDLGCGNGGISLPLAATNSVILVDNSAAMIEAAHRHAATLNVTKYEAIQSEVTALEIEPVDLLFAIGLLAHVDSMDEVFQAMAKYLRPGGLAVVQLSDRTRILNRVGRLLTNLRGRDYQPMSTQEVVQVAAQHGFGLIDQQSHLLILPGMQRVLRSALVPFDHLVRRHPALARHGTDTLLLLQRTNRH